MTSITMDRKKLLGNCDVQKWIKETEEAVRRAETEDGVSRLLIVNEGDVLDLGTVKIEVPFFKLTLAGG